MDGWTDGEKKSVGKFVGFFYAEKNFIDFDLNLGCSQGRGTWMMGI